MLYLHHEDDCHMVALAARGMLLFHVENLLMLVLITAAGEGNRFRREGFTTPKPLIQVKGCTLLEHTLLRFRLSPDDQLLIAVQRDHHVPARLDASLRAAISGVSLHWIELDGLLSGQLATAVRALELSRSEWSRCSGGDPTLLIHNCDTGFAWHEGLRPQVDSYGAMAVFEAPGDHWSFGQPDPADPRRAIAIAEKRRISDLASIGLYGFYSAQRFLLDARCQLSSDDPVHGEHYVAPLLNSAIEAGETVLLPRVAGVCPYGTPAELCSSFGVSLAELHDANL